MRKRKYEINKAPYILGFTIMGIMVIVIIILLSNPFNKEKGYEEGYNYLKDYKINEVIPVYMDDETIAKKYLAEYYNYLVYYKSMAYDLLDKTCKDDEFNTYMDFANYINNANFSSKLKKYTITKNGLYKSYIVQDENDNRYEFIEKSLMNYTVYLHKK